jgi:hypothetical protein
MVVAMTATPSEANGWLATLVYLVVALVFLAIFGPLAYVIGRDANRRGRNGLAWGLLFIWQPVVVGIIYLFVRRKRRVTEPRPDI